MDIFENLCRTCGNECLESLSIYEVSVKALEKMVPIAEMLSACLPANFPALAPSDDYPKQICRICVKKLTLAYEFNNQWVGAHGEFNVAIKYEERRRRSLASKAQEIKVSELPKPQEIPEVAVEGTLPAATEEQINVGTSVTNKDHKNETKRRRRSLASKVQEIRVPELTKPQEIPEVAVEGTLPAATEEQIKFGTSVANKDHKNETKRRRHSRASKSQEMRVPELSKPQEIPEVAVEGTLQAATEEQIKFVTSVANKERKNESKRRRRSLTSKAQESKVPELPQEISEVAVDGTLAAATEEQIKFGTSVANKDHKNETKRRRHSRASKSQEMRVPELSKPQEIPEVAVEGTLAAATEEQIKLDEVKHNFKCAICDEGFLTEKATKFHRLFTHKFL